MKKTVSIILIVVMLLSMSLALLPTFAAVPEGYTAISALSEISGAGKYYLTQDVSISGTKTSGEGEGFAVKGWLSGKGDIILDGGDHTVTVTDNATIFAGGDGNTTLTVKNLKLEGTMNLTSAETHVAPLVRHGFAKSLTLENVSSDVDINISTNFDGALGGIVGKNEGSVTLKNVKYTGNIDISGAANTKNNSEPYHSVGGIIGATNGIFTVDGAEVGTSSAGSSIKVCGSVAMSTGGVIGYAGADSSITNVNIYGSIETTSANSTRVGGVIGHIRGNSSVTNCANNATITQAMPNGFVTSMNMMGGIIGSYRPQENQTLTVNNCVNTGNITGGQTESHCTGMGGIIGEIDPKDGRGMVTVIIANSQNAGNLVASMGAMEVGGIIGTSVAVASLTLANNKNTGNITLTNGSGYDGAGGIIGMYRCINSAWNWSTVVGGYFNVVNCVNEGAVSGNKAGGIWGAGVELYNKDITASFENCINSGDVSGSDIAGGIAGGYSYYGVNGTIGNFGGATFKNCLNEGNITNAKIAGGIVGNVTANGDDGQTTVEHCASKGNVGGSEKAAGIIGNAGHAPTIKDSVTTAASITNANDSKVSGCTASAAAGAVDAYKTAIEAAMTPAAGITLDKNTYFIEKPITITVTGAVGDKVTVYKKGTTTSVGEYTLGEGKHISGVAENLLDVISGGLAKGEYTVKLTYNSIEKSTKDFSVIDKPELVPPTKVTYTQSTSDVWRADGKVEIECDEDNMPDQYIIYWGSARGKLTGYSEIGTVRNVNSTKVVFNMTPNTLVPKGAERILVYAKRDGVTTKTSTAISLPAGAGEADFGTPLYKFNVISDIHVTNDANAQTNKNFIKVMKEIIATCPETVGVFVNGDIAEWGEAVEYQELRTILTQLKLDTGYDIADKMYYGLGNHDLYKINKEFDTSWPPPAVNVPVADRIEIFLKGTKNGSDTVYYDYWIDDLHIVFLGSESGDRYDVAADLSEKQLDWLEDTLDNKKDGEPVLLFLHQGLKNTVAGTMDYQGWSGVDEAAGIRLRGILKRHPEIIMFSGHSHWSLATENTFKAPDEELPAILNTGATKNITVEDAPGVEHTVNGAQGYYITVYSDKIVFNARDFYNEEWIGNSQFVMDWPPEGVPARALEDEEEAEETKPPVEDIITDAPAVTEPEKKKGCGSSIGAVSALAVVMLASCAVIRKKED